MAVYCNFAKPRGTFVLINVDEGDGQSSAVLVVEDWQYNQAR